MSFAVATMKKMKQENLHGIESHDQREFKNHSNKDIDPSRSDQNYDLVNSSPIDFKKNTMDFINAHKKSARAVRKDAVVMDEWIISSDQAFFKNMNNQETKHYFETAVNYFKENYGTENVRYADVHMDETTPHMHMGIVPFTKDYRLSSKDVFNRMALRKIQDDFPKYMQDHGFDVERGHEDSERKKLTVKEYKQVQAEIHKQNERRNKTRHSISENIKSIAPNTYINYRNGKKSEAISTDDGFRAFLKQSVNWLTNVLLHQLQHWEDKLHKQAVSLDNREQGLIQREHDLQEKAKELNSSDIAIYKQKSEVYEEAINRLPFKTKMTVLNQLTSVQKEQQSTAQRNLKGNQKNFGMGLNHKNGLQR